MREDQYLQELHEDQEAWQAQARRDVEMIRMLRRDRDRTQERADKAHAIREKVYQERRETIAREEQDLGRGSWS